MKKLFLVTLMVTALMFSLCITASAASVAYADLPPNLCEVRYDNYFIYEEPDTGNIVWYGSNVPHIFVYNRNTGKLVVTSGTGWCEKYALVDGVWTQKFYTAMTSQFACELDEYDMIYSSFEIKDNNGNVFFPWVPLAEVVEGLQETAGLTVIQSLGKNLSTLVPFGVGCLALLMALPLLFKVLRNFL